jgi:hypothetical protein
MKVKCPTRKCHGFISNIKRVETDMEWECPKDEDRWDFEIYDVRSFFHFFVQMDVS